MSDLAETLWREFATEADEHLETVDTILSGGDPSALDAEAVARLFRSFHSLKGLTRAMGIAGMEALTHAAEDMLGLVRDGLVPLDRGLTGLLLESVDRLRDMRVAASERRADTEAPHDLIGRLRAANAAATDGEAAEPSPPPSVPEPPPLHEDAEMLGFFAETLASALPDLALALAPEGEGERSRLSDAAAMLGHAAEMMRFDGLAANVRMLASPLEPAVALDRLDEVRVQAGIVADATGVDTGVDALAAAVARGIRPLRADAVDRLGEGLFGLMDAIDAGDADAGGRAASGLASPVRELRRMVAAGGGERVAALLTLVEDALGRIGHGRLTPSLDLLSAARGIFDAALADADPEPLTVAALDDAFRAALAGEDATTALLGKRPPSALDIDPALAEILSPPQLAEIDTASERGRQVYELTLFVENDPATGMALVRWLQDNTHPVTNRTVIEGAESGFQFLVVADLGLEALTAGLAAIDPGGESVRTVRSLTASAAMPPVPAAAPSADRARPAAAGAVLRVEAHLVDRFVNDVGEAIVLVHELRRLAADDTIDRALAVLGQVSDDTEAHALAARGQRNRAILRDLATRLEVSAQDIHGRALDLRVVPVETVLNRLPRVVRELAQRQGKQIRLEIEGRGVRVDKSLVEQMADPFLHMVRNAVDHGIETTEERTARGKPAEALLRVEATESAGALRIDIVDDGRGLDPDRIRAKAVERELIDAAEAARLDTDAVVRLILRPGFSTADTVTETSGRGVGMDVVMTAVTRLGGRIDIESEPGRGARFRLHLPLTAAFQDALLFDAGGRMLGLPTRHLEEVVVAGAAEPEQVGDRVGVMLRGRFVPVFRPETLLGERGKGPASGTGPLVVLANGRERMALEVDRVLRRVGVLLRDLHPALMAVPGIGGATVLADGRLVLLLDGDDLFELAGRAAAAAE